MPEVLILPGDGIGPEIVAEAVGVLEALVAHHGLGVTLNYGLLGGQAVDAAGSPLPADTLAKAKGAKAVLLGAVGGPQYDALPREQRPERGLLGLRSALGLFANLRPAILYPQLAAASALRPEVVAGLDILIVRELTGDIYFGEPRGIRTLENGERQGFNTMVYGETEIDRILQVAFQAAQRRQKRLCSVDKANVLETSELWRERANAMAETYPDVTLSHLYVDNAAMQLVKDPKQFDVVVTGNLFGDILSDCAAQLTGSIGMLPSASLNDRGQGLYEPIHGSAPDIAGRGVANPLATILSVAMMLRHSLERGDLAARVETAVGRVLDRGLFTPDICGPNQTPVDTQTLGRAVVEALTSNP
ncbi:MAG: 3-isopropylmalate dehydrogenase [Candidatus Competibacterales bacterium]